MDKKYHIRSVPRMFEEVTRQIIAYIDAKKIPAGGKLPTERKLSELLEVSRSSVREGLRILELLKYLESRQGDGTFVSEPPPFLLPLHIVKQKTDDASLQKYFQIALVQARKIIMTTSEQGMFANNASGSGHFWVEFNEWVNDLGKQLKNDYFLSLWNNVYSLLDEQEFFHSLESPVEIGDLKKAHVEKNVDVLEEFFRAF